MTEVGSTPASGSMGPLRTLRRVFSHSGPKSGSWRFASDAPTTASSMSKKAQNFIIHSDLKQNEASFKLLEMENEEDESSTNGNSDATIPSSNSSFSSYELKSSMKIKTQEDSLNRAFRGNAVNSDEHSGGIHFSKITVHYHDYILGDHPEVSGGAPLALGCWESSEELMFSEYETERQDRCRQSPWADRAVISAVARERMLVAAGVPYRSIRRRITRMKIQKDLQLRSKLLAAQRTRQITDV